MEKEVGHKFARQDLRALSQERNKQNTFLREQLVARIEHASHLETRLLYTLDALDELQASSARELQQVHRENAHLTEKLRVWEAIARDADTEKFDMSSAVLELVTKVESCNDYSKWRAAHIEFSHDIALKPVNPAGISDTSSSRKSRDECTCPQAYSPAVVEELSDSLAREKRAHALSIEEAERRIVALQSRIAVREAEIARRTATCRCLPPSSGRDGFSHLDPMSEEEQDRVTTQAAERSRVLACEVTELHNKVRQGRVRRRSESSTLIDRSVQTEPSGSPRMQPTETQTYPTSPDEGNDPILDALSTLDARIAQLRKRLTDLVTEKEALRSARHDRVISQDSEAAVSPRKRRPLIHNQLYEPLMTPHASDGSCPSRNDHKGQDDFVNILLLEEECIRLMHSESNLRLSLERLQQQNGILAEENARLNASVLGLRHSENRPGGQLSPLSLPPLDTSISAIDSTFPPLQPDVISPANVNTDDREGGLISGPSEWKDPASSGSSASSSSSPLTPTSAIDPSEVPLPRTPTFDDPETELGIQDDDDEDEDGPDIARQPQLPVPFSPSSPMRHSEQQASSPPELRDAHAIERELIEARAEAESREREIAEVRDLMADLALRINNDLQGQS